MLSTNGSVFIKSGNPRFSSMNRSRNGWIRKTRHFKAQSENAPSFNIKSSRSLLNLNYEKDEKEKPLETTSDSFNEINYQKLKSRSTFRFLRSGSEECEGEYRESSVYIGEGMTREISSRFSLVNLLSTSSRHPGCEKIIKFSDFVCLTMSQGWYFHFHACKWWDDEAPAFCMKQN